MSKKAQIAIYAASTGRTQWGDYAAYRYALKRGAGCAYLLACQLEDQQ